MPIYSTSLKGILLLIGLIHSTIEGSFNLLEAPMGSGKSTFIKQYALKNPDKTICFVFFKNGMDDFKGTNVIAIYYNDLFKKIQEEDIDIKNTVVFLDEYDYVASVIRAIIHNIRLSILDLPTSSISFEKWEEAINQSINFLEFIRINCRLLFLVSATKIEDRKYYKYGNEHEVNLLTDEITNKLTKIKINSVTAVRRIHTFNLSKAIRSYYETVKHKNYTHIIFYIDKADISQIISIGSSFDGDKRLLIPSRKLSVKQFVRLNKAGILYDVEDERLNQETFDKYKGEILIVNQSSNRGTSIHSEGKVLIIHYGSSNSNKLQLSGRFRNDECEVDVVYFTSSLDRTANLSQYKVYCDNILDLVVNDFGEVSAGRNVKRDMLIKHYDPKLSYRKNIHKIYELTDVKVSRTLIKSMLDEGTIG